MSKTNTDAERTPYENLPGELVYAAYVPGTARHMMIRREPAGKAYDYHLYIDGARAYGPYWSATDAYARLNRLTVGALPQRDASALTANQTTEDGAR